MRPGRSIAQASAYVAIALLLCLPSLVGVIPPASLPAETGGREAPLASEPAPQGEPTPSESIHVVGLTTAPSGGDATDAYEHHDHDAADGTVGEDATFPLDPHLARLSPYVVPSPTDLDDDPLHRARFVLDHSWGLTGSLFRAAATVEPTQGLTTLTWSFDGADLQTHAPATGRETTTLQVVEAGLHYLTLTATWADGAADRVTTPLYVEDPVLLRVQPQEARGEWDPDGFEWLEPALAGDTAPLQEELLATVDRVVALLPVDKPRVMVLSDFVDPALAPGLLNARLPPAAELLAPISGADPARGFGDFVRPYGAQSALGHDLTHIGTTLAQTLMETGAADVVFVGALDPVTGSLDRAALRNGLLYAGAGGADAVVWGLPSAAYLPALVQNAMRPTFAFDQTPLFTVPADGVLPYGSADWHDAALPEGYGASVVDTIWETAFLRGASETPDAGIDDLVEALAAQSDDLSPTLRRLVAGFRADQSFDRFLQDQVLRLADAGVPFVAPSEECAGLQDRYMTVLGVTHVVGAVTVAAGTEDGPAADSCRGPDRRAAAHGTGVHFVADPRPFRADALEMTGIVNPGEDLPDVPSFERVVPYVPNSMGAALRVATALARLGDAVTTDDHPWKAPDLVGMLAARAQSGAADPWREGTGFLDLDGIRPQVPGAFPRSTEIVFTPFDLQNGWAYGSLQVVVVGQENVEAARAATPMGWSAAGGTEMRLFTAPDGTVRVVPVAPDEGAHLSVEVVDATFAETPAPDVAVVTLLLKAVPTNLPAPLASADAAATEAEGEGEQQCTLVGTEAAPVMDPLLGATTGGEWEEVCVFPDDGDGEPSQDPGNLDPPQEWLLPGLYAGRTWISTPSNGILQLPINVGVGSVFDVYRFLAPDTPVSDTAVCLALPLELIGGVAGLRATAMELDDLNVCIYWANTDAHGVARFYTPLPLPYDLVSFFSPQFQERVKTEETVDGRTIGGGGNGRAPPYYPQIKDSVTIAAPVNVTGLASWAGNAPGMDWFVAEVDPSDTSSPVFVDADLPYPLATVYQNRTYPVAISVHWRYRDNIETPHILPIPSILAPEFLQTLQALPNPVRDALLEATGLLDDDLSGLDGGLVTGAPERLPPLLGTTQDGIKEGVPVNSTYLDALLGQPVTRALPLNLQADPGTCSWGYGHELAPEVRRVVDSIYGTPSKEALDGLYATLQEDLGAEAIPDSLVMRVQPTLEHLLGLTTNIPLCTAVYPFNIPQPNEDTFFFHEFDVHLESTILVVCITVTEVECYILAPNPLGDGALIIDADAPLGDLSAALLSGDPGRAVGALTGSAQGLLGNVTGFIDDLGNLTLPDKVGLASDGHVFLEFEQYTKDLDHGYLSYVALPLDLSAAGFLDPLIGVLERSGISLEDVLANVTVDTPVGNQTLVTDVAGLVRDSLSDLLRTQPYVEVKRPVFFFDTWWWDDSFFDARVSHTRALDRVTPDTVGTSDGGWNIGEDFWWLTFPNINREYFERGLDYWDPVTLRPDLDAMAAADYPWNQAEFFEAVLEFWDDEAIDDVSPNQFHIHSGNTFHQAVQSAKHCTRDGVPEGGERCIDGGLDFEEGDGWLIHDDEWGNGVYDPNQGLKVVMLNDLGELDLVFGAVNGVWQTVWGTPLALPVFEEPTTLNDAVAEQLGINMTELEWWKRDPAPFANRRIYSDMHQNMSYFLGVHTKSCEERADLPHQVPLATDQQPRWKTTCPWLPDPAPDRTWQVKRVDTADANLLWGPTQNGWHFDGALPASGTATWTRRGVHCEPAPWETWAPTADAATRVQAIVDFHAALGTVLPPGAVTAVKDDLPFDRVCGNFDGWRYAVVADVAFDGPRANVWNAYHRTVQPTFHPGTFAVAPDAWNACRAGGNAGWDCSVDHPLRQAWADLATAVAPVQTTYVVPDGPTPASSQEYDVTLNGVALTLKMFGLHDGRAVTYSQDLRGDTAGAETVPLAMFDTMMGDDLQELYATVPVPDDPTGWFGSEATTEFDAFYGLPIWDEIDANHTRPRPQQTFHAMVKDVVADHAPLVRDWLEGDVAGMADWFAARNQPLPAWLDDAAGTMHGTAGNPFWVAVQGQRVPYQDLVRPRDSLDPENEPRLTPEGTPTGLRACAGVVFGGHCRERTLWFDAGDLSGFGRAGHWGREAKEKAANIPQGSQYSRYNIDHLVATENGTVSTRDYATGTDGDYCWFDPTAGHGTNPDDTHLETRPFHHYKWDDPAAAGYGQHGSRGRTDPVPPLPFGAWCRNDKGEVVPAHAERESLRIRLPLDFNGGDYDRTLAPPITPYVPEGGNAGVIGVKLSVGGDAVTGLLLAVLEDVLGISEGLTGSAVGGIGTGVGAGNLVTMQGVGGLEGNFAGGLGGLGLGNLLDGVVGDDPTGSPVLPFAQVAIDPSVLVAEMVMLHTYDLQPGTQGILVASTDEGATWRLLPARDAPGFVGRSEDPASGATVAHAAFVDLSSFSGDEVLLGLRVLGADWALAEWDIHRVTVLPAGIGGVPSPPVAGFGGSVAGFVRSSEKTLAQIDGLLPGQSLLVDAPLTIPAGTTVSLDQVDVVADRCGVRACPIVVEGTLLLEDLTVAPRYGGVAGASNEDEGLVLAVRGVLEAVNVTVRGLLGGLPVLGGEVVLKDCWMVDTGHVGVLSILGRVEVDRCVFADQALGVYALGSEVRVEDSLFYRMARFAGVFDDSWGVVRDNHVFHTKQGGFQIKGPLGVSDLVVVGNTIEQTGVGVGTVLSLEDRILALNPLDLSVPVPARDRIQANAFEWNNLEAIDANALSAPVVYGNHETHSNIGVRIGWLDPAVVQHNTLYSDTYAWRDPDVRASPPDDGNTWAGIWQIAGLTLPVDARHNFYGPGPVQTGGPWPNDLVLHTAQVDYLPAADAPPSAPLKAALTAPGYGGGLVPVLDQVVDGITGPLGDGDAVSLLEDALRDVTGQRIDLPQLPHVPVDQVPIDRFEPRPVTVTWDVPAGTDAIRVNGTYYRFLDPPSLAGVTTLEGLQDALGGLPLEGDWPARWDPINGDDILTDGATHGTLSFFFDGLSESRASWRVTHVRVGGVWQELDEVGRKDVMVHNSLVWPLLPDLAVLVNDLTHDLLDDGAVVAQDLAGSFLSADPLALLDAGFGQRLLRDGTLAVDGVPSLVTLARDQDPIRATGFQFGLSTDLAGAPLQALEGGLDADRAFGLPALAEGVTLTLQGRALDASNLASPYVGMQLLVDEHRPDLQLADTCLASTGDGVEYAAADWRDAAWGPGHRPAGIARLQIDATGINTLRQEQFVVPDADGDLSGSWVLPTAAYMNGAAYVVTGLASDRAGHLDAEALAQVTVDLTAPVIDPQGLLAALVARGPEDYLALADLSATGLVLSALVDDRPGETPGLSASCLIDFVRLQYRTNESTTWTTVAEADPDDDTVWLNATIPLGVLQAVEGRYLEIRVVAADHAGHQSEVATGNLLVDLLDPLPIVLPQLPTCVGAGTSIPVTWGGTDPRPPVGFGASGLDYVHLVALRVGDPPLPVAQSGPLGGQETWTSVHTWDPVASGLSGEYLLTVDSRDEAGNGLLWTSAELAGLTPQQLQDALAASRVVKVDGLPPGFSDVLPGGRFFEAAGAFNALVAGQYVGANPIRVSVRATDPDFSCLLSKVVVSVQHTSGGEQVLLTRAGLNTQTSTVDQDFGLDLTALEPWDGQLVRMRVYAEDQGGNWNATTSVDFRLDLTPPTVPDPPNLLPCLGLAGQTVSWAAADAVGEVASSVLQYRLQGAATWTTLGPSPQAVDPAALGLATGQKVEFRIHTTDEADNVGLTPLGLHDVDVSPPTMVGPPVASLDLGDPTDPTDDQVEVSFEAGDEGCGMASVTVRRYDNGVLAATDVLVPGTTQHVTARAQVDLRSLLFEFVPSDAAGNDGAVASDTILADFRVPTVGVTGDNGFGRTVVGGIDLGPALPGGTVIQGPTSDIGLAILADHPNNAVGVTVRLWDDGAERTGDLLPDGALLRYTHDATGALPNKAIPVRVLVTGDENRLSTEQTLWFLYATADSTNLQATGVPGWTFTYGVPDFAGRVNRGGEVGETIAVDASTSTTARATYGFTNPAGRLTVGAEAHVELKRATGSFDLLAVHSAAGEEAAFYVDGATAAVKLRVDGTTHATGVSAPANRHLPLRLVFSPVAVDAYVDNTYVGTFPLATTGPMTELRLGGTGARAYWDNVAVQALAFGFQGLQDEDLMADTTMWTPMGSGTLSVGSHDGLGANKYLEVRPSAAGFYAYSNDLDVGNWSRASLFFQMGSGASRTDVLSLLNATGGLVMRARVNGNSLEFTDGTTATGTVIHRSFSRAINTQWHRLDVELLSATQYKITLDQTDTRTVARIGGGLVEEVRLGGDGSRQVNVDRLRFLAGDAGYDHIFTQPPLSFGWGQYNPVGGGVGHAPTGAGFFGPGYADVTGLADNKRFLHFPTASLGNRYMLEAAVRPSSLTSLPDHQAVLSGVTGTAGDGTARWAVTVGPLGAGWGLHWWEPGAAPVALTDPLDAYSSLAWHTARVLVDESAGTVQVWVDEAPVRTEPVANLGTVGRIALGDVHPNLSAQTGLNTAVFDDVIAYPR